MKNILVILFLIHSSLSIGQNFTVEEDKLFELLRNNRDSLGAKKNEIVDFISNNPLSNYRIVALEELSSPTSCSCKPLALIRVGCFKKKY